MFGSSNEILVCLPACVFRNLIEFLVELFELCSLRHVLLEHKVGRLVWLVAFLPQELEAVVDEGEIEKQTVASQTVTPMADDLDSSLRIIAIEPCKDLVM